MPGTPLLLAALVLAATPVAAPGPRAASAHVPASVSVSVFPTIPEGGTARVAVSLDRAAGHDVGVDLDTRRGTARPRTDYRPVHLHVVVPAGSTRVLVPVAALTDGLDEAPETFDVELSSPRHADLGTDRATVTIRDIDPLPGVAPQDARVQEPAFGNRLGYTEVRLTHPSGRRVVVELATRPGTATVGDYVPLHPTVVFAPGQTRQPVSVEILSDDQVEGPETLRLVVVSLRHARVVRAGTITIEDADS